MRLIDADALDFCFPMPDDFNGMMKQIGINMAKARVMNAPTIEAAPVVHGRWIEDDARGRRCCSVCEFEVHDDASHVMFGDWRIAPNYCLNCGARMDGDSKAPTTPTTNYRVCKHCNTAVIGMEEYAECTECGHPFEEDTNA